MGFSKPLCAVAAGRARAAGEQGAAQSPQARAGGVGARRGEARAAPGPGEWSNLTAGTRRRRAAGNGGGGGGAGRHREAWAVTRAPERGPMVLEGPRRPVLQVRRAPPGPLCVRARGGGGGGTGRLQCPGRLLCEAHAGAGSRPRRRARAGEGPRGPRHPGTQSRGLSAPRPWEERALTGPVRRSKPGRRSEVHTRAGVPGSDPGLPNGAGPVNTPEDQEGDKASGEVMARALGGMVVWFLAGDQGWPQGAGGRGHLFGPSPLRSLCLDLAKGLSLDK